MAEELQFQMELSDDETFEEASPSAPITIHIDPTAAAIDIDSEPEGEIVLWIDTEKVAPLHPENLDEFREFCAAYKTNSEPLKSCLRTRMNSFREEQPFCKFTSLLLCVKAIRGSEMEILHAYNIKPMCVFDELIREIPRQLPLLGIF